MRTIVYMIRTAITTGILGLALVFFSPGGSMFESWGSFLTMFLPIWGMTWGMMLSLQAVVSHRV